MTLIDAFFNCVLVYALGVLLRVIPQHSEVYFQTAFGFYLAKTALWLGLRIPLMLPIDRWEKKGSPADDSSPSLIRAISYFPFHFTLFYGALVGGFYAAFVLWMVYGPGPIKLGTEVLLPAMMWAGSVCSGAIAIGVPVNLILTAHLSRRLAERRVASFDQIPGKELSLRLKMATIALALGCAPSLLLFSVQSFVQDHGLYQEAERGAEVVMNGLASEEPEGFKRWVLSETTYPFWVENGRLTFAGDRRPSPESVASLKAALFTGLQDTLVDRQHRFVVRTASRPDGVQGVLIGVPDPQNDWLALSLVVLLASFWPLLTASLLVKTIVVPVSTIASTFHQIMGRGRTEGSDRVPIFYKDEVGRLAFNANRTIDTLTEARGELEITAQNLAQKNRELEQAYRTKGEFLANMSHELRTPLNAIIGFSRLMKRKLATTLPERQAKNLDLIAQSGEQLLALVNDLLDFEKIEAGKLDVRSEEFELKPLWEEVVTMLEPLALEKRLTLKVESPEEGLSLKSDRERLRQILTNLITNAIKYSDSGVISVSTRLDEEWLSVTVADQGIGMSPEQLEKIFDPFHQVDASQTRERGGVGLGLAIVARLVGLLRGRIEVESLVGKGSTFSLRFPLEDERPQNHACRDSDEVLVIVEDDAQTSQLLSQMFEETGITPVIFGSERQAREHLANSLPAVLVLDLGLEQGCGWSLLAYLRGQPMSERTRVFVYTAADLSREQHEILEQSRATVVSKHGHDSLSQLVGSVVGGVTLEEGNLGG